MLKRVTIIRVFSCGFSYSAFIVSSSSEKDQKKFRYKYVLIGNTVASRSAYLKIREKSPFEKVLIIDKEISELDRPANEIIFHRHHVKSLDIKNSFIEASDGSSFSFEKCLIASGYAAATIDLRHIDFENVLVDDVRSSICRSRLVKIVQAGGHVTIVGMHILLKQY